MEVFKFGGASVKDLAGVQNLVKILDASKSKSLVVVVSAMGKTTNALEKVVQHFLAKDPIWENQVDAVFDFHKTILLGLFADPKHSVYSQINCLFRELSQTLDRFADRDYDFVYDQIVSFGELLSTTIVHASLSAATIPNTWIDARKLIQTDATYREALVDWQQTRLRLARKITNNQIWITQGFIGSNAAGYTTTLGREGSDYTAAIIGSSLAASRVTVWKDVQGVRSGDPKIFKKTHLLSQISYDEAVELAFYGASVIHPKTIQPLKHYKIPLFVRSFLYPKAASTTIQEGVAIHPRVPCFILKTDQILLSLASLDLSFVVEESISEIFNALHQHKIRVRLLQNSAISFSVCLEDKYQNLSKLIDTLKQKFKVTYYTKVSLYTIRHFNQESIAFIEKDREVLVKQTTTNTCQLVVR